MFRRILPLLLVVIAVLLDTSVVEMLFDHRYVPLLSLMTVVVLGLLLGRTRGALYGLVGGLLIDVPVGSPFGLMSLVFVGCGYLAGIAGRKYQRHLLTPVVTPLLCFLIYELVMFIYVYIVGAAFEPLMLRDALIRISVAVVASQLMYLLYNRILRPSWSRYASR